VTLLPARVTAAPTATRTLGPAWAFSRPRATVPDAAEAERAASRPLPDAAAPWSLDEPPESPDPAPASPRAANARPARDPRRARAPFAPPRDRALSRRRRSWEDRIVDVRAVRTGESSAAPLAVEPAQLDRALGDRLSAEAALRRVATLVARQHAPEEVFALVSEEVARHLDAELGATLRSPASDVRGQLKRYGGRGVRRRQADRAGSGDGARARAGDLGARAPGFL
jgi:hypothetical protein